MIPKKIEAFIKQGITIKNMCLPQAYLDPKKINKMQAGFRYNALTNESLVGNQRGEWKENWYVVATNYFLDPFYVDFMEDEKEFPVYYDLCGSGWNATKVADSLAIFENMLKQIESFERINDLDGLLIFLEENTNIKNKLWKKVYRSVSDEIKERSAKPKKRTFAKSMRDAFVKQIVITNVGENKTKVAAYLRKELKLSLTEVMGLLKKNRIIVNTGRWIPKADVDYLVSLGVTFEADVTEQIVLKEEHPYKLKELIDIVINDSKQIEEYCLYTEINTSEEEYDENLICYLGTYPDKDDNYPDFIEKKNLEYYYMGEQFSSVISVAANEKLNTFHQGKYTTKEVAMAEYVKSLRYYNENDTFMTF